LRRKLVLAVIDGLTPALLERGIAAGRLPTLALLRETGAYTRATTTFPSVTPVCLTSIATGAHPDVHHVPHLVWYHRGEERLVEYGSSFPAMRAVGARRSLQDSVFEMTRSHLAPGATTVFEALEDAGYVTAAINFTCYRGRTRHAIRLPAVMRRNRRFEAVNGPTRFFFFNLFESDATGAPLAIRSRPRGSIDTYAAVVGRWLVTRDGFDFLVFYLPDFDYASHAVGPEAALDALEHADACLGELLRAAGGHEEFLQRYAILVCSDHGQTPVERVAPLADSFAGAEREAVVVAASNRAGMIYRLPGCRVDARRLAQRLDDEPGADVVLFRENGAAVARRDGAEVHFAPEDGGWRREGEEDLLEAERYPNALERAWRALACPNAGDVLVSAAAGYEFADLGGGHHAGGGSHGSLLTGDSTVPVIAAGFDANPLGAQADVTDIAPLVLAHFGVAAPASMRAAAHA
jgi:predicted AlkP superfamily pyrophosphatase or phosphodiesterase